MICLPFAGGGTAFFQPWTKHANPSLRLRPICLPGREERIMEPAFTQMAPLLDWLDVVLEPFLDRPHVLFGHSMGGIVGYALCQRRMQRGQPLPQALIASACLPPPLRRRVMMHQLDKPALLDHLLRYDPANQALGLYPELWDMAEPVLRADFTVVETYDPGALPALPIPVIALSGRTDPLIAADDMTRWSAQAAGFRHHILDGGHFFPRDAPVQVLECINSSLRDLVGSSAET
jgi:medium-chain acyl-[acyl-carrier-protein] hydrolase